MPRCWRTEIRAAGAPGPAHHPEIQCRGRSGRPGRPVRRQVRGVCACPTAADDIALMAFTIGTTGKPKAAMHTHRDVLAACECWPRHVLCATPDDIVMGSPPLAFTFGLGGMLMFPDVGRRLGVLPGHCLHPEAMVRLMAKSGVTICYTAPTFYRQMAPHSPRPSASLRCALCVSAGEGLPDATRQLWKRGHRHRDDRRHRRHRDVPHLHLVGRGRGAARRHRQGGAGLHREGGQRRGRRGAARHGRQARGDRPHGLQATSATSAKRAM
jgi:hypothetical protein